MSIKLYRVILPVKDIEIAAEFYAKLFDTDGERVSPGRHYFACGQTILACYDPVADGDELENGWHHHSNQYIYFAVSDLEKTYNATKDSGGEIEAEIEEMPWGERLFYARDPSGNPISFVDRDTVFKGSN